MISCTIDVQALKHFFLAGNLPSALRVRVRTSVDCVRTRSTLLHTVLFVSVLAGILIKCWRRAHGA